MVRLYRTQRGRQRLLARYGRILVASRHMAGEYLRHGIPEDSIRLAPLFPPGIAPDLAPPPRRAIRGHILLLGRLTPLKGGALLLEALRLARGQLDIPLRVTIAGEGSERASLEVAAKAAGGAAEFVGWVAASDRLQLMRDADLLAVPSVWPEPFGLVGIEAGCVGLPAVGFATGGITDWLIPGETGESAPADPPTAAGLADAIVRALRDPDHQHRLRVGAWQMAQTFTLGRHLDVLEPILAAAARG